LEKLLKGCIPDVLDDMTPAPSGNKPKKHKKPIVVDDELPFVSEPDSTLPSDDISQFQSEPDIGTSDGEGLSDAVTSNMSDFVHPEGKPYVLRVEG
jgi:hypothetical protein